MCFNVMCYAFVKEAGVAKYACAALSSMAEAEGKKMIKQLYVIVTISIATQTFLRHLQN